MLEQKILGMEAEMQLKDAEFHSKSHELSFKDRIQVEMREKEKRNSVIQIFEILIKIENYSKERKGVYVIFIYNTKIFTSFDFR